MHWPFQDMKIVGVAEERCFIVGDSVMRIYLQLSAPPPVGWSYLFNLAWQAAPQPIPRRVGIDGDALWIECPPAEVLLQHMEKLEACVAKANQTFLAAYQARLEAEMKARRLAEQAQAQLTDLARVLNPPVLLPPDAIRESPKRGNSWLRAFFDWFPRFFLIH